MGKSKKDRWLEEAQKNLEKHEYKQLASWGEAGSEVWECSRPGSSTYAFTICITRMGIAVVGDIDGLSFNVGTSYGMSFLAGNDVSYYIHSKLEHKCREEELNEARLKEWVACTIVNYIGRNECCNELVSSGIALPEWLTDDGCEDYEDFDAVQSFVELVCDKLDVIHPMYQWFQGCRDTMEDAACAASTNDAYELSLEGVDFDWSNAPSLTQPCECLMVRLHMINEAAKCIMAQKEKLAA